MATFFSPQTDIYKYSCRENDMQPHWEFTYVLSNWMHIVSWEYLSTDLPQQILKSSFYLFFYLTNTS